MDSTGFSSLSILFCILFFLLFIGIVTFWIYIASVVDVLKKDEKEFKDRTLWLVLLIGSLFIGMNWLTGIIYYVLYKPRLKFWKNI